MRNAKIIGGFLAAALLLALLIMASNRAAERALALSPLGSEGLALWLPAQGVTLERATRRDYRSIDTLSLRVLPLLDAELDGRNPKRDTSGQEISQRRIDRDTFEAKVDAMPTLVILPKWDGRVATENTAVPDFRIKRRVMDGLLSTLWLSEAQLRRMPARFSTLQLRAAPGAPERKVALFAAQLFDRDHLPEDCAELLGSAEGILAMRCGAGDSWPNPAIFLSDPDLMNNHGLTLAENAPFAAEWIAALRGPEDNRPVYLDTTVAETLRQPEEAEQERIDYTRDSTDFARFFSYPLSVFWGIGLAVLALALWRGAMRFGPPARAGEDRIEASKTAAIEAKARLLRLSGNDGRMAGEFARAQLLDLAAHVFGPGHGLAALPRLYALIARRDATLAQDLQQSAAALIERGAQMGAAEVHQTLYRFRDQMKRVTHELG